MAIKQNVDYGFEIQKLYLEMMLADAETFIRCQSIFDSTLFDKKLQLPAEFINEYVKEHSILPTVNIVNAAASANFESHTNLQSEHFDWLLTDFETFTRHKGLERAILESADLLEKGDYGPVEEMIKKAVQVGLTKDLGTNYFEDPKQRLLRMKDKNGQVSTGWKDLDFALFGGMNRGELHIFAGLPGSGKSTVLANLGINWALQGLNVVYITLELNEDLVSMRMDSMITGIPSRDIFKKIDDVETKIKLVGKKAGSFQVKFMPSSCKNANDIRSYLKEYEIKTNRKVDVAIVDYLDLLIPTSKKIDINNQFNKDKFIAEELRNLMAEKQCIGVSASQINRSGVQESEFDHSHIAGGISKINTADGVYAIYSPHQLKERGIIQLQLTKTRNSNGEGKKIDLNYDIDTLRITDLPDDAVPTSRETLVNQIKQRATTQPTDMPKVRAEVHSSKLKDLINNLPDQDDF